MEYQRMIEKDVRGVTIEHHQKIESKGPIAGLITNTS